MSLVGADRIQCVATPVLEPWRIDLETYHRLVDSGCLEDEKVELLDGVLTAMTPQGESHSSLIAGLTRLAVEATPADICVRIQMPLELGEGWVPEPDLVLTAPGAPSEGHRTEAGLVVEVAVTSQRRDREIKVPVFGRAGVPETWVIDVAARVVQRYTEPVDSGYSRIETLRDGELRALRYPNLRLEIASLWR